MAATISFLAGQGAGTWLDMGALSGLGFFGNAFGSSVQVGQYQDTTYITDANGSVQGPSGTNTKFITSSGVSINGGVTIPPSSIVVNSGTMNIRFAFNTPVQTQTAELRIFDRVNSNNGAVGVLTQVLQLVNGGSGVSSSGTLLSPASHPNWIAPSGSGIVMSLLNSPGSGGLSPSGALTTDLRHDWYGCFSATPLSIGQKKQFGLYVSLEYF